MGTFGGYQVLIDPVCLLTIYPQLLRNFLYKVPTLLSSSSLLGVIDWMRYLFSRDLLIAEVLLPPEDYLSGLWKLCN